MITERPRRIYLSMALALLLVLLTAYAAVPALADTWNKANADGFGNKDNSYILSMAEFGGYLYAGTSNVDSGAQLFRSLNGSSWSPVTTDGFGNTSNIDIASMAVFNNRLYAGTRNVATGCEVWEYDGTTWNRRKNNGFGSINNGSVTSMKVFGNYLYAGTGTFGNCGLWRTNNGTSWTQVVGQDPPGTYGTGPGFGDITNNSIMSMAVFEGRLYAGTYRAGGAQVWKSSDGTSWNGSVSNGFNSLNTQVTSLTVFGGRLYAGTFKSWGGEVWRTSDGTSWNRVVKLGFETGDQAAQSLAVFNDELYAGTWGCRVFRSGDGTDWSQANTSKFGDSHNGETPCMSVFEGQLYAGTGNFSTGCELWRTYGMPPSISKISPGEGRVGDTVTISGSDFHSSRSASYVKFGNTRCARADYVSWSDDTVKVRVPDGASGETDVSVTTTCGTSNKASFKVTVTTYYLAEGSTAWGFSTYITIENPNTRSILANVTFMPKGASRRYVTLSLPARSQTTLTNDYLKKRLGQKDFSTLVECRSGLALAADRTMEWTGQGAPSPEGHCSVGATSSDTIWYLPEGSSAWGFETWVLVQNPNKNKANVTISYMRETGDPVVKTVQVPAYSRESYSMKEQAGVLDASIGVTSDQPVIAERSMYRNNRREGHESIGARSPAETYYLAEGCTGFGFQTYVLIQNPADTATEVNVTYMTGAGPVQHPENPINMPPNSRKTIDVNKSAGSLFKDPNFSTTVEGSQPILAERAMYWGEGTPLGEACHDSIGMAEPHSAFYLPDGQTSEGRETWTLVQNPNASAVTVEIRYMTPTGTGNVVKTETIDAGSRRTFGMLEHSGLNRRAAIMVTSKTSGKKIMCERAMYWNARGAGTDTIGGFSD